MKRQKWDPNYADLIGKDGPGILLLDRETEHDCKCGVTFMGTRNSVWCAACKPAALVRGRARSQAKQAKKRKAARSLRASGGTS